MANNTLRIVGPGRKGILWAHNEHVRASCCRAGHYLQDSLGDDYLSIGMTFSKGSYWATGKDGASIYPVETTAPGSFESILEQLPHRGLLLNLAAIRADDSSYKKWFAQERDIRVIGIYSTGQEFDGRFLLEEYDYLLYVREISPTDNFYYDEE